MENPLDLLCGSLIVIAFLGLPFVGLRLAGAAMVAGEDAIHNHDRQTALDTIRSNPQAYCFPTVRGEMYSDGNWTFTREQVYEKGG